MRLSTKYPTLEVRVCDTQLRAEHAVAIAELIRSAAVSQLRAKPRLTPQPILDAELWHAARFGVTRGIHNPYTGAHDDARTVLEQATERLSGSVFVTDLFERALGGALGSDEQRRTRGDLTGLTKLFLRSFAE